MSKIGKGYENLLARINKKIPRPQKRAKGILRKVLPLYEEINKERDAFIKVLVDFYKQREDFNPDEMISKSNWINPDNGKLSADFVQELLDNYPLVMWEHEYTIYPQLRIYTVAYYQVILFHEDTLDVEKIYEHLTDEKYHIINIYRVSEEEDLQKKLSQYGITRDQYQEAIAVLRSGEVNELKDGVIEVEKEIKALFDNKKSYTLLYVPTARPVYYTTNHYFHEEVFLAACALERKKMNGGS